MAKFVAPNLDNATPTSLLDEMGRLSIMEGQIKKLRAVYKVAYYARTGIDVDDENFPLTGIVNVGDTFIATTTRTEPERFNQTAFAVDHADLFEKYKASKPQLTTRFNLKEGVVNPVVNDLLEQMKQELGLDQEES